MVFAELLAQQRHFHQGQETSTTSAPPTHHARPLRHSPSPAMTDKHATGRQHSRTTLGIISKSSPQPGQTCSP